MSKTKEVDNLAIHKNKHKPLTIQVKTKRYQKKQWTLGNKCEGLVGDNIFYVFVSLNEMDVPHYHIIPSHIVADTVRKSHEAWLKSPGKQGQVHNNNPIRKFSDEQDQYLNNWECLLKL